MSSIDFVNNETASTLFNSKNVDKAYQLKSSENKKILYNKPNFNESNKLIWNTWRCKPKCNNLETNYTEIKEILTNSENNVKIKIKDPLHRFNSLHRVNSIRSNSLHRLNSLRRLKQDFIKNKNKNTINQSKNPFDLFSIDKKSENVIQTTDDKVVPQNFDLDKLPMCERAFNTDLCKSLKNMDKWSYMGTFTSENDIQVIRLREKVLKRRTQNLQNLTKIRYRCNTYRRTKCKFQMFALFVNDKIDLYKCGTHNHIRECANNLKKKKKSVLPDFLKKPKPLTQEEILKDLMGQSTPAYEVITVNTNNNEIVLKNKNVDLNANQNLIVNYTNKIMNEPINLPKYNLKNSKHSFTKKFESTHVKHIAFHQSTSNCSGQKLVKININSIQSSLTNEFTFSSMLSNNIENNLLTNNIVYFDPSNIINKESEQSDSFNNLSVQLVQDNNKNNLLSTHQFILSDSKKLSDLFQIALEMNIILSLSDNPEIVEYVLKPNSKSVKISRRSLTISETEKGFIKITNYYNSDVCCQEYWKKSDWSQFLWAIRGKCSQLFSSFT